MTDRAGSLSHADRSRWAPWWLYLSVLLGANYVRGTVISTDGMSTVTIVAIAAVQAGILYALITLLWRAAHRPLDGDPQR